MSNKTYEIPTFNYNIEQENNIYRVLRNEEGLKTPKGNTYDLPNSDLANAVAQEWSTQGDKIVPAIMPLTQLAATALDVMPEMRAKVVKGLVAYTRSELLCHRAEYPQELVTRQKNEWQPLLDWCNKRFSLDLVPIKGVVPMELPDEMKNSLQKHIEDFDNFWLTGLQQAADVVGSLVIGLAIMEEKVTASQALELSELDIIHQQIAWGEDPVTEARHKGILFDLKAVEKWFGFLRA